MKEIEDYRKEIEVFSKEDHELHQQVGLSIARHLQQIGKNQNERLRQSQYILKIVYCHFNAYNRA